MGAPHNKERYGETWPAHKVIYGLQVLKELKPFVVISGGWAWHFMSPPGHVELKHAHDHKDIDLFVEPIDVSMTIVKLKQMGFNKVWTKYDNLPSDEDFRRYEKTVTYDGHQFRVTIDFFIREVPHRKLAGGFRVVEPKTLLSFYSNIHSSDKCFAVQSAVRLLAAGIDPVGRPELVQIPD